MIENIPIQEIQDDEIKSYGVKLFILRTDLNHPYISGNKWYKLKYNLKEARKQNKKTLLTFGGAFSNHIAATAAAGKEFNFNTIGIIRGEEHLPLNPTLAFAKECRMYLHYVSRESYRNRNTISFIKSLEEEFGCFYLLPEGGSNSLAVKGCMEILKFIPEPFNYVCCPCGTGATLAGMALALQPNQQAIGFSSLKGAQFLEKKAAEFINRESKNIKNISPYVWHINHNYHFGGYAKINQQLVDFIKRFELKHRIPLDYIYTGKMMFGIYDMIKQNYFKKGNSLLAIHTGGLQGNSGFERQCKVICKK